MLMSIMQNKHIQIILVGTSHTLQCGNQTKCNETDISEFRKFVSSLCDEQKVKLIAEEMSLDALQHQGCLSTIAAVVAAEKNIAHINIDLTCDEQTALRIDDSSLARVALNLYENTQSSYMRNVLYERISHQIRERVWLARILSEGVSPTLFICGADHIQNFHNLTKSINQEIVVAARNFPDLLVDR